MGVKLFVIGILAAAMTIPALLVYALIADRRDRAAEVTAGVSESVGGSQTFLGPVLIVPIAYASPIALSGKTATVGDIDFQMVIYPERADSTIKVKAQVRHRSLFKVPVYQADLQMHSSFDLKNIASQIPPDRTANWSQAYFAIGTSDTRGAMDDPTLVVGGATYKFAPVSSSLVFTGFVDSESKLSQEQKLNLFGVSAGSEVKAGAAFDVTANLKFSGAQRLAVIPWGKTTKLVEDSDWPNPSFNGEFLPRQQSITATGFHAEWDVPFIARGVPETGSLNSMKDLAQSAMGVSFVVVADPYQSVTRSLKYAILFLGLVFMTYFMFEISSRRRIHPAQYVLVGVAQIVFYLLLVAFAERIGFDAGFLVAALATVGLLSLYARWVFESVSYGVKAFAVFGVLYGLIYILLRLEDEALLVGSVASFAVIAALMYATRRMDWYSTLANEPEPQR